MPIVEQHTPGSFCWFELATTDQSAAKDFYQGLFGWNAQDFPMGPGGTYTMFNLEGRNVGACYTLNSEQKQQGVPPNWLLYLAVQNADETARRATELGAQVFMPPFDVDSHGRMTVMADPTGAVFGVWQANQHPGVGVTGVDGTVCWADLRTTNTAAAKDFYSQLFGWEIKAGEQDPSGYLHIFNGQSAIGGIPPSQHLEPGVPPHWLLYFLVSDCAAAVAKAKGLGANILMPTMEVPNVGFLAILQDPQGAVFAFYQAPDKPRRDE
jgi:predicted enzyme related to lactoylglutathione lyase